MYANLEQKIRARAHQIWEQSGCLEGFAEDHWRRAELEIASASPAEASAAPTKTAAVKKAPAPKARKTGAGRRDKAA